MAEKTLSVLEVLTEEFRDWTLEQIQKNAVPSDVDDRLCVIEEVLGLSREEIRDILNAIGSGISTGSRFGAGNLIRRELQHGKDYTYTVSPEQYEAFVQTKRIRINFYQSFYLQAGVPQTYTYYGAWIYNARKADFAHIDPNSIKLNGSGWVDDAVRESSSVTGELKTGLTIAATFLVMDNDGKQARVALSADVDSTGSTVIEITATPLFGDGTMYLYPYELNMKIDPYKEQRESYMLRFDFMQAVGALDDFTVFIKVKGSELDWRTVVDTDQHSTAHTLHAGEG